MRAFMGIVFAVFVTSLVAVPASAEEATDVTYYKDVLPIIQNNCQSCHRPAGLNVGGVTAPMAFMNYAETRPWARAIGRKVESREMPPWYASAPHGVFSNERRLSDAEVETMLAWVDAGAPAGDPAEAPAPRVFVEDTDDGWSQGRPDFAVKIPEPYFVEDDVYDLNISFYKQLTEVELAEDTWLQGWEFKTGTEGVVHHMCGFVTPPSANAQNHGDVVAEEGAAGAGELLTCIAEGAESVMLPEDYGFLLKKGSTLTFNLHYHKEPGENTGVWSQPEMGFHVRDDAPTYKVTNNSIGNRGFELPPNISDYRIGAARTLEKDTQVLTLWPHAHLRGTASRYTATYPDGTEELLLDVPNYDQGWQETYKYTEPKLLPKGTRIDVSFWYDNTPGRAATHGFDPNTSLGHGPRTDDEMSLGFIGFAELYEGDETGDDE